jgi:tRNA threonylcarbamoyladenosine biosynthesis protein TsaE
MILTSLDAFQTFFRQLGQKLLTELSPNSLPFLIHLNGNLGAGKTTATQALAQGLGIQDTLTSPTFGLVKSYAFGQGLTLHHWDMYRLPENTLLDLLDFREEWEESHVHIVEWPNRVVGWPAPQLLIELSIPASNPKAREVLITI